MSTIEFGGQRSSSNEVLAVNIVSVMMKHEIVNPQLVFTVITYI